MVVQYAGTDPLLEGKTFDLAGGSAWTPERFNVLREMNPKGKVVALTETGEKHLLPIGDLSYWKGY